MTDAASSAQSESSPVGPLWARLESWLGDYVPHLVAGLAAPADEPTLAAAQSRLGRPLPDELRELLTIHDGGQHVIGGWDLLGADGIANAYQLIQKYADEPERAAGWIPFVDTVTGDYLCIDVTPDPTGAVGQIFMYRHDDDHDAPIATDLASWLARIATTIEANTLIYDPVREEFLPFYGATGFAIAFKADPPLRLNASHSEVSLTGPRTMTVEAIESVGPLPVGARIELITDGTPAAVWDLDQLRESEQCVTEYNILIEEPIAISHVATTATLRVTGLTGDDTMWIHLVTDALTAPSPSPNG